MKTTSLFAIVFAIALVSVSWTSLNTSTNIENECLSIVSAQFNGTCVTVQSDKDLSNVVIGCMTDPGSSDRSASNYQEIKFDNLTQGMDGTFCCPNGGTIVSVWIKSGCNESGEGPGYGERIDAQTGN